MKGLEKIFELVQEGGMEGKEVKFTPHWDRTVKITITSQETGEIENEVWVNNVEEMYRMIESVGV